MTSKAPRHLKAATRRWWEEVVSTWDLEPHHVRLLTMAAEAWDRAAEARAIVDEDGACLLDRFGQQRAHPMLAVERDCRIAFARLVRELGLDVEPASAVARPPRLRGVG